ncbi:hypothetical protein ACFL6U_08840 [Planctomycetota bacterium]
MSRVEVYDGDSRVASWWYNIKRQRMSTASILGLYSMLSSYCFFLMRPAGNVDHVLIVSIAIGLSGWLISWILSIALTLSYPRFTWLFFEHNTSLWIASIVITIALLVTSFLDIKLLGAGFFDHYVSDIHTFTARNGNRPIANLLLFIANPIVLFTAIPTWLFLIVIKMALLRNWETCEDM